MPQHSNQGLLIWLRSFASPLRLWVCRHPRTRRGWRLNNIEPSIRNEVGSSSSPYHLETNQQLQGNYNVAIGVNKGAINFYQDSSNELRQGKPFQAPPLPQFYIKRPEQQKQLKEKLLEERDTLVVSAVYGLGGIGKSVLASAIAHDLEVKKRFFDGVLWATLGQNPNILSFLIGWIQALGDFDFRSTTVESASTHLRSLLNGKHVLLVIDDVWDSEHIEFFRVGDTGCCVLVTTREAKVRGSTRYDLDVMSEKQAIALLEKALPKSVAAEQKSKIAEIAKAVGYLPLALELAAAQIEEQVTWDELLEDLCQEIAHLEILDRKTFSEEPDEAKRRSHSLIACFNLSLRRLTYEHLQLFGWLGVLPEDTNISARGVSTLWQLTPKQSGMVLRVLRNRALLLMNSNFPTEEPTYRMHDLMHDKAIELLLKPIKPASKGDLPGLGLNRIQIAHQQLLARYLVQTTDGLWYTLPNDGYIHSHLSWHFEQADQPELIHHLLKETTPEGRNGWYEACYKLGQVESFISSLDKAWQLAKSCYDSQPEESIVLQLRYALITTTLYSLVENVPSTLVATFIEKQFWTPEQGMDFVQQVQNYSQRAEALAAIASLLPASFLKKAISWVNKISPDFSRAETIISLSPHLPEELFYEVLDILTNLQNNNIRIKALIKISPYLPEFLLNRAYAIALSVEDKELRAAALASLAPHRLDILEEALEASCNIENELFRNETITKIALSSHKTLFYKVLQYIKNESDRTYVLSSIVTSLPQSLFGEAFLVACNMENEKYRARALIVLIPYLTESFFDEILKIADNFQSKHYRSQVLATLLACLPSVHYEKSLLAICKIDIKFYRIKAFNALASQLPESLQAFALDVASDIKGEGSQILPEVLTSIAPYLSPNLFNKALKLAGSIRDDEVRSEALTALAPHLPESLLDKALDIVSSIREKKEHLYSRETSRTKAFVSLAPHLPEFLFEKSLKIIGTMRDEPSRAEALTTLAPHLSQPFFNKAFDIVLGIRDNDSRAKTLTALAPFMPKLLLDKALELISNIRDKEIFFYIDEDRITQAKALSALAPRLSDPLIAQALEIVGSIQGGASKTNSFTALAPYLPESLLSRAIEIVEDILGEASPVEAFAALTPYLSEPSSIIRNQVAKTKTLTSLAPRLSEAFLDKLIEVINSIQDEEFRTEAFIATAPYLPDFLLDRALDITRNIQSTYHQADKVRALITVALRLFVNLPDSSLNYFDLNPLDEALDITATISDESSKTELLISLAPHLPEHLFGKALGIIDDFNDESFLANLIVAFIPHLPKSLLSQVLEITQSIKDENHKNKSLDSLNQIILHQPSLFFQGIRDSWDVRFFTHMAAQIPKALLDEALDVACHIQDEKNCSQSISALAPYLTGNQFKKALEAIRKIQNRNFRAQALNNLITYIPEKLFGEVLESAQYIGDEGSLIAVFIHLSPYLPSLYDDFLDFAYTIQDQDVFALALTALSIHQPKLFPQALDHARKIEKTNFRAHALATLASYHREVLFKEVFEKAQNIQSEIYRAQVIAQLTLYQPSFFEDALSAARNVQDKSARANILLTLVPCQISLFNEVVDIALSLQDESISAILFSALALQSPIFLQQALELICRSQDDFVNAIALVSLATQYPDLLPEALTHLSQSIQNETFFPQVVDVFACQHPGMVNETVDFGQNIEIELDAVCAIENEKLRADSLCNLAPHLSQVSLKKALDIVFDIQNESFRVRALCIILFFQKALPLNLLNIASEIILNINSVEYRSEALSLLAFSLSELLFGEAIDATHEISDAVERIHALFALIPYKPSLLNESLETVLSIQSEDISTYELSRLAPYLPQKAVNEILGLIPNIQDEEIRAQSLSELVPYLSKPLLEDVLNMVQDIQGSLFRVKVLASLAPHKQFLLSKAIDTARAIEDERVRAKAFSFCLPCIECTRDNLALWQEILHGLSSQERKNFIQDFSKLRKGIVAYGGEDALKMVLKDLKDVFTQWP